MSFRSANWRTESRLLCFVLFLVAISFVFLVPLVSAYDETYTHPYLTKLIIEQWEQSTGLVLSEAEQAQIIAGSQAEDNPHARSLNHFYNPLNKRGLSINDMLVGYAAPDWLNSVSKQKEPLFMGSFTWSEGLEFYKKGEREQALAILGHSLHLLQDMAMPAHTRNDEHVEGDGYETWIKEQNSLGGQELAWDSALVRPVACDTADHCLRQLAKFTNANFFSVDTIYDKNFPAPKNKIVIGFDNYARANGHLVAYLDKNAKILILNPQVYRDNWRVITPELISYGVRLMNLFLTAEPRPLDYTRDRPVKKTITPQISAGGVKITTDDDTLYLNQGSGELKPLVSDRWWPIIDMSRVIPREFLNLTPPIFFQPQIAGVKIESEPATTPNTPPVSSEDVTPPPPPPLTEPPVVDPPPPPPVEPPPPPPAPDTEGPQATFIDLNSSYPEPSWTLNWQGADNVSPVSNLLFDVDFKFTSDWTSHLASTTATSSIFSAPLADNATVDFRVRATDEAGNIGAWQEASVAYLAPDPHNPLIYEKLEHLYHLSECSGALARDTIAGSNFTVRVPWITGPWDCGLEQGPENPNQTYLNAAFNPMTTSELTLSFWLKDVAGPGTFSRNRWWLSDASQGFTILQIKPTTQNIRIAANRSYDPSGIYDTLLTAIMPADHNWHSLFLTVNSNYLALYIDGVLAEQLLGDFSPTKPVKFLTIVGENAPTQFDEIALWSRALSSEEIRDYYNIAKPLKP